VRLAVAKLAEMAHFTVRDAARQLGVSVNTFRRLAGGVSTNVSGAPRKGVAVRRDRDEMQPGARISEFMDRDSERC
jgi:hypothetical protein